MQAGGEQFGQLSWEQLSARLCVTPFDAAAFVLAARRAKAGGAEGIRTPDPHNAIVVLYQLSYDPSQSPNTLNT